MQVEISVTVHQTSPPIAAQRPGVIIINCTVTEIIGRQLLEALLAVDDQGHYLQAGDIVQVRGIPATLLEGLPDEDRDAIQACVGKQFPIAAFDEFGNAEIEFVDGGGDFQTIWIDGTHLRKIAAGA